MSALRAISLLLPASLLACESGPVTAGSTTGAGPGTEALTEAHTSQGEELTTSSTGDAPPAPRLDIQETEPGCEKIDFLFVIDNSLSMGDEQQLLIDGFPGFIQEIQETIAAFDYHIMVVGTSSTPDAFDPCDAERGGGRVRSSDGEDCGLVEDFFWGERFIDNDAEHLDEVFACVADVGIEGDPDEASMWSMADALTKHAQTGACNEGFLRDDAILVVTIITDEEDDPMDGPPLGDTDLNSPGTPQTWRDGLVEVKGGDEEAVVVLALVGDTDLPEAECVPFDSTLGQGAEPAPRLRSFAESFTYGAWSPVCVDDYAPFFINAVSNIENSCAGFEPQG